MATSTTPTLRELWAANWGELSETTEVDQIPQSTIDYSRPPTLWPKSDGGRIMVAPVNNAGHWFTLIKINQSEALSDRQRAALLAMGFKAGDAGRFIQPSYPDLATVENVSKILGLPLEPLDGTEIVTLKSDYEYAPSVPLEVQSGIRWYWKNRPDELIEEILRTLESSDGELPERTQSLLNGCPVLENGQRIPSRAFANPSRLQAWVADALSGEKNEVTESILHLGLLKGAARYGNTPSDWPDYLQVLHRELRELRGEPGPETRTIETLSLTTNSVKRPPVGSRVNWMKDNTRITGTVAGYDEDEGYIWVTSEQLPGADTDLTFLHFPVRQKMPVTDIVGFGSTVASDETITQKQEDSTQPTETEQQEPANYEAQPDITLADLTSDADPRIAEPVDLDGLGPLLRRVRNRLTVGEIKTKHPIMVRGTMTLNHVVDHWGSMGDDLYRTTNPDQTRENILKLTRDELLKQFNAVQPMTVNGVRSPLAVLPAQHGITKLLGIEAVDPDAANQITPFRVGFHPNLHPDILDRLEEWETRNLEAGVLPKELVHDMDTLRISVMNQAGSLDGCAFGIGDRSLQKVFRDAFSRVQDSLAEASLDNSAGVRALDIAAIAELQKPEHLKEIESAAQGTIFTSLDQAHEFLEGKGDRFKAVTETNRARLNALVELTGKAPAEISALDHPMFVVLDTLEEHGLPSKDRAEALALLNVDLSKRADLLGQLARLSGLKVDALLVKTLQDKPEADTAERFEKMQAVLGTHSDIMRRGVDRAAIFSGMLGDGKQMRPFQTIIFARSDSLLEDAIQRGANQKHNLLERLVLPEDGQAHTSNRYHIGLGRLIDLHCVAPLSLGNAITQKQQILSTEELQAIKPTVFSIHDPMDLTEAPAHERLGLSAVATTQSEPTLPSEIGLTKGPTIAREAAEQLKPLQTIAPAWRSDSEQANRITEAFTLCLMDSKGLKDWRRKQSLAQDLARDFRLHQGDAQMGVYAFKVTKGRTQYKLYHDGRVVTSKDIAAAGGDRDLAAQRAIIRMKSRSPETRKGYHFTVFDAATVLRPDALRFMKDEREKLRRQLGGETQEETGRRGKRQDKGLVAGLAIKDLRGKAGAVLDTLDNASAEDQARFITKTKLWPAPDWTFLRSPSDEDRNDGARPMEPVVAVFFDELRTRLLGAPPANDPAINKLYAKLVLGIRDAFDHLRTKDELTASLSDEEGHLRKLYEAVKANAEAINVPTDVIFGEGIVSDVHWRNRQPFESVYRKATRRSLDNTRWDIKDRKGSYRPDTGDADKPRSGAMPMLEKLVRKGAKDYRADLNVSEQTMIETFGFSGIEYGNSMTQVDRETYLNEAYDGFMDLASVLKVPPKALSLGGTLGLAFGSRGTGGRRAALAHFEPANNVINLTRMKGAGSMAHEFGHAFANHLFRLARGVPGSRAPGDITTSINEQINGRYQKINGGNLRQIVTDAVADVLKAIRYTPLSDAERPKESDFIRGARRADSDDGRKPDKAYWASIEELFARSFETFVNAELKAHHPDFRNDFLVRPDKLKTWGSDVHKAREEADKAEARLQNVELKLALKGDETAEQIDALTRQAKADLQEEIMRNRNRPQLYPAGHELSAISKAYNTLFDVLETKEIDVRHDHLGAIKLPILYSHATGSIERIGEREHEILAQCVLDEVARMCGPDVFVRWRKSLNDEQNRPVAGQYRDFTTADHRVQAIIELALGAPISTAHHEAFHFAQKHLLSPGEQAMMDRQFAPDSTFNARVVASLMAEGDAEAASIAATDSREAQAYGYAQWVRGKLDAKESEEPKTVFGRIKAFFGRVTGLSQNAGFSDPDSLFRAFHQGVLRQRAEQNETLEKHQNDAFTQHKSQPARPQEALQTIRTQLTDSYSCTHTAKSDRTNSSPRPAPHLTASSAQTSEDVDWDSGPFMG